MEIGGKTRDAICIIKMSGGQYEIMRLNAMVYIEKR